MRKIASASLALLLLSAAAVVAQTPPPKAPPVDPNVSLQPVVIYDAAGNIVSNFGGGGTGGGAGGTVYQGGVWTFGLSGPIPAGSNVIGGVTQSGGPWSVSGSVTATLNQGGSALSTSNPIFVQVTNLAATQPVSGTVAVSNLPTTQPVSGSVSVSNFPGTQPISAANLPLPSGAATAALQNGVQSAAGTSALSLVSVQGSAGGVPIPVSGSVAVSNLPASQAVTNAGTFSVQNTAPIVGGNTAAVKVDGSGVTQPVSGTVTANQGTSPWSISGAVTQSGTWTFGLSGPIPAGTNTIGGVTQSGTWTVAQGAAGAAAWKVDGSGTTQPVSAAALPLPAGAATSANQASEITALQALNTRSSFGGDYASSITANTSFNGQSFTASAGVSGSPARGTSTYTKFNVYFSSSAAGTAYIDGSNDNASWQPLTSGALSAGAGMFLSTPIIFTYYRGRVANGGTAATGTLIQAGLAAN